MTLDKNKLVMLTLAKCQDKERAQLNRIHSTYMTYNAKTRIHVVDVGKMSRYRSRVFLKIKCFGFRCNCDIKTKQKQRVNEAHKVPQRFYENVMREAKQKEQ